MGQSVTGRFANVKLNIRKLIMSEISNTKFYSQIVDLLQSARTKVVRTVNQTMVLTYFEIGKMIVEEEQGGKERAEYGKDLLKGLSNALTKEFGKGFSTTNLKQMRQFYFTYSKGQTLSDDFKNKSSTLLSKSENQVKHSDTSISETTFREHSDRRKRTPNTLIV